MIKVKISSLKPESRWDFLCHPGEIKIGDLELSFLIILSCWNLQDYLNQWKEGIKRINDCESSCLVTGFEEAQIIDGERCSPRLYWMVLYKKNDKVIIQELRFPEDIYDEYIGTNVAITKENCYDYIPKYNHFYPIAVNRPIIFWELSEEEFNKKFSIEITNENLDPSWYCSVVSGAITIGSYVDNFKMRVFFWSIEDYKKQWRTGIERLHNHDSTCLITDISEPMGNVGRWFLYKRDGKIVFYYDYIYGVEYSYKIGNIPLTKENCYDFIPAEQDVLEEYRVKEWEVDLKEFDGLEVLWPEE